MGGIVGASESNMREVISQVEAVAPCVLWVDEIEKGLSGTKSSGFSDGGTLSRVFGTLLTAMEERMEGVVTIATANDIQGLPPELIRRFNEIMFVDLPMADERKEIWQIHLRQRKRDPAKLNLNLDELVHRTEGFTGSEIEKIVKEGIARAFHAKQPNVSQEIFLGAIADTKPISKVMGEKIKEIREWAKGKARYASSQAEAEAQPGKQKVKTAGGKEFGIDEAVGNFDDLMAKESHATNIDLEE